MSWKKIPISSSPVYKYLAFGLVLRMENVLYVHPNDLDTP